ncbi:hypothetical protein NECID01_0986 [Nematocida sp. AWRm77]|nr:hypothetical protein NECID01_0986 [Nematocida sp. AWRm77]
MKKNTVEMLTHEEVLEKMKKHSPLTSCSQIETMRYTVQSLAGKPSMPSSLKEKLLGFNLTPFEAIQLINTPPKTTLDVYVIVEELEERFTEKDIEKILALLSQ